MRWLKKHLLTVVIAGLLTAGLGILLYPSVAAWWNGRLQYRVIADYDAAAADLAAADHTGYLEKAEAYNEALRRIGSAAALSDPGLVGGYEEMLVLPGSSAMGYVRIDKIGVELPIYHGTGETALARGAGHLEGSSLPVGGEGTHCVISGHAGMPSARLFTDIVKLEIGDTFELHVLGDVLAYEIDQTVTVLPTEIRDLYIERGKDLCTLMTCTPYGINTHRLLIRGHRIPYEEAAESRMDQEDETDHGVRFIIGAVLVAAVSTLILSRIMVAVGKRRKR